MLCSCEVCVKLHTTAHETKSAGIENKYKIMQPFLSRLQATIHTRLVNRLISLIGRTFPQDQHS